MRKYYVVLCETTIDNDNYVLMVESNAEKARHLIPMQTGDERIRSNFQDIFNLNLDF